ncbi:MAG: OmpA family protein [Bacteroidales bacterium]|jgi:outer membrane protein OmpA-like peptidoglycan-associated protein|nr:OmpA family protein [Bacteroidales bacterium]
MKKILLIILYCSCLFSGVVVSQTTTSNYTKSKKALKLFDEAIYDMSTRKKSEAIKKLNKAIETDVNFLEAYFMLAEIYEKEGDLDNSVNNYEKAYSIDPDYDALLSLKLAINTYKLGRYNEAKEYIDYFLKIGDVNLFRSYDVDRLKTFIYFAWEAFNNPVKFNPINLGDGVNTDCNEYWPSLSIDEEILVFTRGVPIDPRGSKTSHDNIQEDLFVSHRDPETGKYMSAVPMGGVVNTPLNEGAQCISGDGKTCIITACNRPDGKGSCDLYIMFLKSGRWTEPENMTTVNTGAWESNPSLTADGKTLYFASNRTGGYGKIDIWKIDIDSKGRAVSDAVNLGPVINTPYNDVSPCIHPDNMTLYFGSDGHPGMGSLDLFWSKLDDDGQWQTPVNLGYPINTNKEERSLIVNAKGDIAMYASSGGKEDLDIYYFEIPEEAKPITVTYVKGYVYDNKTNERLQSQCELLDLGSGEILTSVLSEEYTGEYMVSLPVNRDYAFNVSREGYLFYSENFSLTNLENPEEPYIMNIPLKPIEKGVTVVLKNIFFEFASYELLPESYTELNKIVEYMTTNPTMKIEIGGHTDNVGSKEYNKRLSQDRAKAVYDYLIRKEISKDRLSYQGYDFSVPVADNDTEEGRAQNRRTEFKVISID